MIRPIPNDGQFSARDHEQWSRARGETLFQRIASLEEIRSQAVILTAFDLGIPELYAQRVLRDVYDISETPTLTIINFMIVQWNKSF